MYVYSQTVNPTGSVDTVPICPFCCREFTESKSTYKLTISDAVLPDVSVNPVNHTSTRTRCCCCCTSYYY